MGSDSGHPGILDTINLKWFYHKFEVEIPRAKFENAKKKLFSLMKNLYQSTLGISGFYVE